MAPDADVEAVNADGSVVVGTASNASAGLGYPAFRRTAAAGKQAIPPADGLDVSADGSLVTGGWWTQSALRARCSG